MWPSRAQEQQREWEQRQSDLARVQNRCEQLVACRPLPLPVSVAVPGARSSGLTQSQSLGQNLSPSQFQHQQQLTQLERLSRLVQQRSTHLSRSFALLGYVLCACTVLYEYGLPPYPSTNLNLRLKLLR